MGRTIQTLIILLTFASLALGLSNTINQTAQAADNDSAYSYLALPAPVTHKFKSLTRKDDGHSGHYINEWAYGSSTERYSYYKDSRGWWTFQREQINRSVGKYFERYIWSSQSNPSASSWLYSDYISWGGDQYPSQSNSATCTQSPFQNQGCDYISPAGQEWLPNITARPDQGANQSPAIMQWDSSTIGVNQGDLYYQGGVQRIKTNHQYYGQIWKRNTWNNYAFKAYPDIVNSADTYGWADPGTVTDPEITLAPKYVYIVRQYSACDNSNAVPWHACEVFEDHVYAKDAANQPLGEVMVVIGFTPKHDNWYQIVGEIYAVTYVMIAK